MEYRLTYGMLLEQLKTLNAEQLKREVAVFDLYSGEVNIAFDFDVVGEEEEQDVRPDTLDQGYPYLVKE
jgi:hypothetical protein